MDQTQTDTPSEYSGKHDEPKDVDDLDLTKDCDLDTSTDNLENADIIDPLVDLMDSANCKNEYPSDDSDVWNASDSEDETPEKNNVEENRAENISEPVSSSDPPRIIADEDGNKSRESSHENEAEKPESDRELPSELPNGSEHEEDNGNEETSKEIQTPAAEADGVCDEDDKNEETPTETHTPPAETNEVREEENENNGTSRETRTPTSETDEAGDAKANDEPEPMEQDEENAETEKPDKSDDKTEEDKSEPAESEKSSEVIDLDTTDDTVKDKGSCNEASDVSKMDESTAAEEEEEHQEEDKTDKPKNATDDSTDNNSEAPEKMSVDEKTETKEKSAENNEEQPEAKDAKVVEESSKPDEDEREANNDEDEMEYGDDFDPTLLCPEVEMAVDEEPVITENSARNEDGSSPLPYAPTFETYVDEVTGAEVSLNLTAEEEQLRRRLYGSGANIIQAARLHCTACNVHLGSALKGQNNRFVHPMLKVLICKECYHFYTSGEFEKDEDGSELYCRWCGQGGQVMCCSTCEVVFCKKCIRNNFGRKKLLEIRDSDWSCFKCQPSQIMRQRVACAEFFEYVRREMSRASTLDDPEFMSRDYSLCCNPNKKTSNTSPTTSGATTATAVLGEASGVVASTSTASTSSRAPAVTEKKKRRKKKIDPDYDPMADKRKDEPSTSSKTPTATAPGGVTVLKPFLEPTPRRIVDGSGNIVSGVGAAGNTAKTGGGPPPLVLNPMRFNFKPFLPMRGSGGMMGQVRPSQPRSTFITVPMQQFRSQPQTTTTARTLSNSTIPQASKQNNNNNNATAASRHNVFNVTTTQQTSRQNTVVSGQPKLQSMLQQQQPTTMKHDWFEKTVRAAAKVNSHLSYTLTQLNKAQSQAGSIEELAVVHNKLQEILSNSINSLIQIRKNLRAEFIAGIKTVRFPPKKPELNNNPNDDDVIFVSAPSVITVPVVASPTTNALQKSTSAVATSNGNKDNASVAKSSGGGGAAAGTTNGDSSNGKPRPYLKVKSVFELQNVPSECITIPDDPVPPPPPLQSAPKSAASVAETPSESSGKENLCNGDAEEQSKSSEKEKGKEKNSDKVGKDKNKDVEDEEVCDKDKSDTADQNKDDETQDKQTDDKKVQDETKNADTDSTTAVEDEKKDDEAEEILEAENQEKDQAKETKDKASDNGDSVDEEMPDADSHRQDTNKKEKPKDPPKSQADDIVIVDISDDDDEVQPPAKPEKDSITKPCVVSLAKTDEDISIISDENEGSESSSSRRRRKSKKRRHRESSYNSESFHYNINEDPPPKVKRMMAVKVNLPRVAKLEKLLSNAV